MFGEFLNIVFKSIKLDKSLYSDNKNFGEASIYFAGMIMILDGIAGAVAANTVIKTAVAMSGLTAILTWFIWAILIFVIGVKIFLISKPRTRRVTSNTAKFAQVFENIGGKFFEVILDIVRIRHILVVQFVFQEKFLTPFQHAVEIAFDVGDWIQQKISGPRRN